MKNTDKKQGVGGRNGLLDPIRPVVPRIPKGRSRRCSDLARERRSRGGDHVLLPGSRDSKPRTLGASASPEGTRRRAEGAHAAGRSASPSREPALPLSDLNRADMIRGGLRDISMAPALDINTLAPHG
jgi:hypothetical protein